MVEYLVRDFRVIEDIPEFFENRHDCLLSSLRPGNSPAILSRNKYARGHLALSSQLAHKPSSAHDFLPPDYKPLLARSASVRMAAIVIPNTANLTAGNGCKDRNFISFSSSVRGTSLAQIEGSPR
jgi:hypothetical protein